MDTLKIAVASIADLADRQLMLLLNAGQDYSLPINLNAAPTSEQPANHGFKAMQISASALTAEALRNTMPATSFSRSTESHNQDKVSMGTIAARDAIGYLTSRRRYWRSVCFQLHKLWTCAAPTFAAGLPASYIPVYERRFQW